MYANHAGAGMEKEKIERVKAYLEREYGRNVNLLAALQSGIAKIAHMEEEGCLLCVAEDIWQLCAETEACAERLLQRVPEHAALLGLQQTALLPFVEHRFGAKAVQTYHNVWYAGDEIGLPACDVSIRMLNPEEAEGLAAYYHLPEEAEGECEETKRYLKNRALDTSLFGGYIGENLVGFVGIHDEGSIGLLTVLPEYRCRGVGTCLERFVIARMLQRGWIPFGQVAGGNEASLAVQRKIGMAVSQEQVAWLER